MPAHAVEYCGTICQPVVSEHVSPLHTQVSVRASFAHSFAQGWPPHLGCVRILRTRRTLLPFAAFQSFQLASWHWIGHAHGRWTHQPPTLPPEVARNS